MRMQRGVCLVSISKARPEGPVTVDEGGEGKKRPSGKSVNSKDYEREGGFVRSEPSKNGDWKVGEFISQRIKNGRTKAKLTILTE